jgi:hypothetical protein
VIAKDKDRRERGKPSKKCLLIEDNAWICSSIEEQLQMTCFAHPVSVFTIINADNVNKSVRGITPIHSHHHFFIIRYHLHNRYSTILRVIWVLIIEMVTCEKSERFFLPHFVFNTFFCLIFYCVFNFKRVNSLGNAIYML